MRGPLISFVKFLVFVLILNVIRYALGGLIEKFLIFGPLFGAMEKSASCFNTQFSTWDWATSYFYNFMMWFTTAWVFAQMDPVLKGNPVLKSLKVYGLMFLMFASISAIYMNHYRHPKDFYFYNILDALLVFPLVAIANGLLYPLLFKK